VVDVEGVEDAGDDEVDDVVEGLGHEVPAGVGGADDGAGVVAAEHVVDVNAVEGGFAVGDDEGGAVGGDGGSPLLAERFQRYRRSTSSRIR